MDLQNLSVTTNPNGIGVNFTASPDPALSYLVYIEKKYIQQKNAQTLPGDPSQWVQATGWFNPAGNAFWDGRQTSVGPMINIMANSMNNALIADGTEYELLIAVFKKVSNAMEFVGLSQIIMFDAPKLYDTPSQYPVNYSPKVTVNCDNTLTIELAPRAGVDQFGIAVSGDGFSGMQEIARVNANPTGPTIYQTPEKFYPKSQYSITGFNYGTNPPSPANSTTLIDNNFEIGLPAFTPGLTYQYGVGAFGTPCPTTPPATTTTTTKTTKKGGGKK
jgi:hypothetical protein